MVKVSVFSHPFPALYLMQSANRLQRRFWFFHILVQQLFCLKWIFGVVLDKATSFGAEVVLPAVCKEGFVRTACS